MSASKPSCLCVHVAFMVILSRLRNHQKLVLKPCVVNLGAGSSFTSQAHKHTYRQTPAFKQQQIIFPGLIV